MIPTFDPSQTDGDAAVLLCPHPGCQDTYLHHGPVYVFERTQGYEDGPTVTTIVKGPDTTVSHDGPRNPSFRRNGLIVHFTCEICGGDAVLSIHQHKGCTYVDFVPVPGFQDPTP
jgi:hypothetical protein